MSCQHIQSAIETGVQIERADVDGCPDCLAEGFDDWVHLRVCCTCGRVGCCDSSPRRHATAHFVATSHPVMRSYEPGESWRWCFADELLG